MDRRIRKALEAKAAEVEVPAGAWGRVRGEIGPVLRQSWWRRYRIGGLLEAAAVVGVVALLVWLGAAVPGRRPVPASSIPVVEERIAERREIGSNLENLLFHVERPAPRQVAWAALDEANGLLKPFGYRIEPMEVGYAVYRGDELLLERVGFGQVTVKGQSEDFIFRAWHGDESWLVRASGVEPWEFAEASRARYQAPVYAGDYLITVRWEQEPGAFVVTRNEEPVLTVAVDHFDTVRLLTAWSGHWVLEIAGTVYIDGRSVNEELGYEEVFGWRLLDGKPFYFFRKGKQIGMAYDGQVLPYRYDEVPHYFCCAATALNPLGNQYVVQFFGRRGGNWYWVEVGEEPAEPGRRVFVPGGRELVSSGPRMAS